MGHLCVGSVSGSTYVVTSTDVLYLEGTQREEKYSVSTLTETSSLYF